MGSGSIYRSEAARVAIYELYERARERLQFATESRMVPTRFGETHVLVAGPPDGPPVVALQGGNVVNPLTLAWLTPLVDSFRIYAPDTIGQPGKTLGARVSANDSSLGDWTTDVLEGLGLPSASFIGASYGAGVLLRLAAVAPARIDRAVLVVPAGMTSVPVRSMLSLAAGYLSYRALRRPGIAAATVRQLGRPGPRSPDDRVNGPRLRRHRTRRRDAQERDPGGARRPDCAGHGIRRRARPAVPARSSAPAGEDAVPLPRRRRATPRMPPHPHRLLCRGPMRPYSTVPRAADDGRCRRVNAGAHADGSPGSKLTSRDLSASRGALVTFYGSRVMPDAASAGAIASTPGGDAGPADAEPSERSWVARSCSSVFSCSCSGSCCRELVDYDAVRAALAALTPGQLALLGAASAVAYVANAGPTRVLVPGLSWPHAVGSDLAARAVVSTVPGPTDVATRLVLYRQWSIPTAVASAGIVLAALFETFSYFALPLIATAGLLVSRSPDRVACAPARADRPRRAGRRDGPAGLHRALGEPRAEAGRLARPDGPADLEAVPEDAANGHRRGHAGPA